MPAQTTNESNPDQARDRARTTFLTHCQLSTATITPLDQDASFRRYFRITTNADTDTCGSPPALNTQPSSYILMDAPPHKEPVDDFVKIRAHLSDLGLRPPRLVYDDPDQGFLLLEDLGQNTYTRLLDQGEEPLDLYRKAIEVLVRLHNHSQALDVAVPHYDTERLVQEASLFVDWYVPAVRGEALSKDLVASWHDAWHEILSSLPATAPSLVLRDFHVDNLMRIVDNNEEVCALLDFQDAVTGPRAYDLVSLLEDARRDVSPALASRLREEYTAACPALDVASFNRWYDVLGAQRHAKVLGIFTRLCVRDGKPHYLTHISRVTKLFNAKRGLADMQPVDDWLARVMPHLPESVPPLQCGEASASTFT